MPTFHHGFQFNSLHKALETYKIALPLGYRVVELNMQYAVDALPSAPGGPLLSDAEVLFNVWIGPNDQPDDCTDVSGPSVFVPGTTTDGAHAGPYKGWDNIVSTYIAKTGGAGHAQDRDIVRLDHAVKIGDYLHVQANSNDGGGRIDGECQYTITLEPVT